MDLQVVRNLEQLLKLLEIQAQDIEAFMVFERDQGQLMLAVDDDYLQVSLRWQMPSVSDDILLTSALSTLTPNQTGGFPMRCCVFNHQMTAQVCCPLPLFKARLAHRLITRLVECMRQQHIHIEASR